MYQAKGESEKKSYSEVREKNEWDGHSGRSKGESEESRAASFRSQNTPWWAIPNSVNAPFTVLTFHRPVPPAEHWYVLKHHRSFFIATVSQLSEGVDLTAWFILAFTLLTCH